jgi:ATP-dependent Clp protease ATP-binding subunit ClpX
MSDLVDRRSYISCSFCGKTSDEVKKIITGLSVLANICDECIILCHEIIAKSAIKEGRIAKVLEPAEEEYNLLSPTEIKARLDETVVGQERAKKVLSVAVYNHFKRIMSVEDTGDVEIKKSNILLIGPTGTGKTLLAQSLARVLEVPFASVDATSLTEAGYIGEDVEVVLARLLDAAGNSIQRAQKGIIYIDEMDKIASKVSRGGTARDVSGEGVQQALLKILEGTVADAPPKVKGKEGTPIDTKNILFICGGAFVELADIISERERKQSNVKTLGFGAEVKTRDEEPSVGDVLAKVVTTDLEAFGLIPELIGRIPIITTLTELSEDMLVDILKTPKDAIIKQYQKLFKIDDIKIDFSPASLKAIANKAIKLECGARGLRSILETLLLEVMFKLPNLGTDKISVKKHHVEAEDGAQLILSEISGIN